MIEGISHDRWGFLMIEGSDGLFDGVSGIGVFWWNDLVLIDGSVSIFRVEGLGLRVDDRSLI